MPWPGALPLSAGAIARALSWAAMPPRPFAIDVPQHVIDDLHRRLDNTRWPDPFPGAGWDYGADLDYIKQVCDYWRHDYDWRAHEASLNRHTGYLCSVDGVDIHFWHVRGKGPSPFPLLLIHGWPGSIYEFDALIEPLTDPGAHGGHPADAFDVVVPALPGFGFSGRPAERGWRPARIGAAFDTLMTTELGYGRYGCQGGDWGGIISARMGAAHAGHVAGIHLNFAIGQPPENPGDEDRAIIEKRNAFQAQETGYSALQGSKPMSLGIAQADSPAGIAAWIIEKFRTWSDCGGDIESVYTKDQLLTNIMFYWAPNSIASAARIYYEAWRDPGSFRYGKVEVPAGIAAFPGEPWMPPRHWVEPRFNIQRWTEMPKGGHFAAMEQPQLLIDDVRAFFRHVR
jgi:pimeloyl-ACP methyl ester carboxylesterase